MAFEAATCAGVPEPLLRLYEIGAVGVDLPRGRLSTVRTGASTDVSKPLMAS